MLLGAGEFHPDAEGAPLGEEVAGRLLVVQSQPRHDVEAVIAGREGIEKQSVALPLHPSLQLRFTGVDDILDSAGQVLALRVECEQHGDVLHADLQLAVERHRLVPIESRAVE